MGALPPILISAKIKLDKVYLIVYNAPTKLKRNRPMATNNSTPKKRGLNKVLAEKYAVMQKGNQRTTVGVNLIKSMEKEGWKRVN